MTKVVLITGASEGIGRATAQTFASHGYQLVLAARTADPLTKAALALESEFNCDVLAVPTDVTDPEQTQTLITRTLDRYDHIDCLINNAGICMSGSFAHSSLDQIHQLMNVNFWGYIHTIRAVLPHFLNRRQGQIINVGSFGGKMPLPGMATYCASKYAVTGLTDALRLELTPKGIRVIGVHPGVVNSDFMKRALFAEDSQPSDVPLSSDSEALPSSDSGRAQMQSVLDSWFVSQPEDIATAIWQALVSGQTDVVVGAAQVATSAYCVVPEMIESLLQVGA